MNLTDVELQERPVCSHPKKALALFIFHSDEGGHRVKENHMVCDRCGTCVTCTGEPTEGDWVLKIGDETLFDDPRPRHHFQMPERLVGCRKCGHPWELHRDGSPEPMPDLCQGTTAKGDGVCRCARVRYPTEQEWEDSFDDPNAI